MEKIIVVNHEYAEIFVKTDRLTSEKYKKLFKDNYEKIPKTGPQFKMNIGSIETFERSLQNAQSEFTENDKVSVTYETRKDFMGDVLSWVIPLIILALVS